MTERETVPCETCQRPTAHDTKRCNNCRAVERKLPDYMKSPNGWDFVRRLIPKLDDWVDGHPDAWDYDAVLRENEVQVEWSDEVIDGCGTVHRAGEYAGCRLGLGLLHAGPGLPLHSEATMMIRLMHALGDFCGIACCLIVFGAVCFLFHCLIVDLIRREP